MKSISIADRFCPQNHEAAITAVAYDPQSNTRVTADANGLVVVCRNGEATPGLTLQAKGAIRGALSLMKGGSRLAVGDDAGTIYVYDLRNGELLFIEERSGERGVRRAFRGISINKTGTLLAAVSIDNLLRIWDLRSEKRLYQWYGFDDGHYSGARIIELISRNNCSISSINKKLPKLFSTPELNISVTDENKFKIIEEFSKNCLLKGEKITIDGLRINFDNGWGLIRASNTTPKLVLRFEGNSKNDLESIQKKFIDELARICPYIDINLE